MDLQRQKRLTALKKKFSEYKSNEEVNYTAVDAKWHDIMSTANIDKAAVTIAKIRSRYIKQSDRCDAIITRLFSFIEDGENQLQYAVQTHAKNMEQFLDLSEKRIDREETKFEESIKPIVEDYERNHTDATSAFRSQYREQRDIVNAIEREYEHINTGMETQFRQEKDQITTHSQELISTLRTHLMEEIRLVQAASEAANEDFKRKSEGKMQQFNQMFEEHKQRQKQMKKNEDAIIRNAQEISHWRRKLKANERESKDANDRLRQEKEDLSLHFRELKEMMAKFRATESKKLAEISVVFEDINKELLSKFSLAEQILKYAEMTRKLETEREQILPFPKSITETDPEISRQMNQFKLQLRGDSKYVGESDMFDKFYRKYNKVLLDTLALKKEDASLLDENNKLKRALEKYVGGTTIKEDLMNAPNPLLIVNQETNAPQPMIVHDSIPVVDGGFTVANTLTQRTKRRM